MSSLLDLSKEDRILQQVEIVRSPLTITEYQARSYHYTRCGNRNAGSRNGEDQDVETRSLSASSLVEGGGRAAIPTRRRERVNVLTLIQQHRQANPGGGNVETVSGDQGGSPNKAYSPQPQNVETRNPPVSPLVEGGYEGATLAEVVSPVHASGAFVVHGTSGTSVTLPAEGGRIVVDLVITADGPIGAYEGRPTIDAANVASLDASSTYTSDLMLSLPNVNETGGLVSPDPIRGIVE